MSAGRASGKRTLVDLMDEAEEEKKRKHDKELEHKRRKSFDQSRYFSDCRQHTDSVNIFGAGPSRRHTMDGIREGTVDLTQDEVIVIEDEDDMAVDSVTQEDGYLSPSPSISRVLTPDLSSPVHPISKTSQKYQDSELISSPQPTQKSRRDIDKCHSHTRLRGFAYVGKENDPPRICFLLAIGYGSDLRGFLRLRCGKRLELCRAGEWALVILCCNDCIG